MLRVQWVHRLGEVGPGPNIPDPAASPKAGGCGWCPHPAGTEGEEEKAEAAGREGQRRQLSAGCLSTGKPEGQGFPIFIVITARSSHCNESATGLACAYYCLHCTVRNPPAFPPFLQYSTGWDTVPGCWQPHFAAPATSSSGIMCLGTAAFNFSVANARHYNVI